MSSIELKNVSTSYSLNNINLEFKDKELVVLLGSTGAGKTTILNVIAGLVDYRGSVLFDGMPVDCVPTGKRNIGYLFQDLNLFPHLDVFSNIAFGLKKFNLSKSEIQDKVEEILHLINIEALSKRYPKNLSGGEKQRVALARALVSSPDVLLLDEPMSSLDRRTSKHLMLELKMLQKKLGITTIYVTHDFYEAEKLADRIAVIEKGRLEQIGRPSEIFFYPTKVVSEFIGTPNILICDKCYPIKHSLMIVECDTISLVVADEGKKVKRISILPEDLYLSAVKPTGPNVNSVQGDLINVEMYSFMVCCTVKVGKYHLNVKLPQEIFEKMHLKLEDKVWLVFNLRKLQVETV